MPLSRVPAATPCCGDWNGSLGFTASLPNVRRRQTLGRSRVHGLLRGGGSQRANDDDRDVVVTTSFQGKPHQSLTGGLRIFHRHKLANLLVRHVLRQPIAAENEDVRRLE